MSPGSAGRAGGHAVLANHLPKYCPEACYSPERRLNRRSDDGHYFAVSELDGSGYDNFNPSTFANGVITCGWDLLALRMSVTDTPRANSASPISDRWQRQGTASAHMIAVGASEAA